MNQVNKDKLLKFLQRKTKLRHRPIDDEFFVETLSKYLSEFLDQNHNINVFDFEIGEWVYVVRKNHNGKYFVLYGTVNKRTDHGKGKVTYEVLNMNLSADRVFKDEDSAELRSDELNGFSV